MCRSERILLRIVIAADERGLTRIVNGTKALVSFLRESGLPGLEASKNLRSSAFISGQSICADLTEYFSGLLLAADERGLRANVGFSQSGIKPADAPTHSKSLLWSTPIILPRPVRMMVQTGTGSFIQRYITRTSALVGPSGVSITD